MKRREKNLLKEMTSILFCGDQEELTKDEMEQEMEEEWEEWEDDWVE